MACQAKAQAGNAWVVDAKRVCFSGRSNDRAASDIRRQGVFPSVFAEPPIKGYMS